MLSNTSSNQTPAREQDSMHDHAQYRQNKNQLRTRATGRTTGLEERANSLNAIKILANPLIVIDPTCHRHKKNTFNVI